MPNDRETGLIDPNSRPAASQRQKETGNGEAPSPIDQNFNNVLGPGQTTGTDIPQDHSALPTRSASADHPTNTSTAPARVLKDYSNEARVYHARYAVLSEDHDKGSFYSCREGCKALLLEPNLPRYTRIQTLQMLCTLLAPPGAEHCLQEAAEVLKSMDATKFQVVLLKSDNEKMMADLNEWRSKHGFEGIDLEETLVANDESEGDKLPAPECGSFDRDVQQKLDQELKG